MAERAEETEDRFTEVFGALDMMVTFAFDDDDWDRICEDHPGPETRFGWTTPFDDDESPVGLGIAFHVDRIVDQSAHLDDMLFGEYVDAIEYQLNHHLVLYDDYTAEERAVMADDVLYENGPGSMQLMSDVQLAALDRTNR